MSKAEQPSYYLSLKSIFEQGSVVRMRDIEKIFPTHVAKDLKINHSRYIDKLYNPEKFSFDQIARFASLVDVDPQKISMIIFKELKTRSKKLEK